MLNRATTLGILVLAVFAVGLLGVDHGTGHKSHAATGGIMELTTKDFKEAVKKFELLCICFYSKKSRTSKEFEPIYEKFRDEMLKENKKVHFARIDLDKNADIEHDVHVLEVPMLQVYKSGRHYDFRGSKTVTHLKTWIHLALNVPVIVSSSKELEDLKNRGTIIVGCFPGSAPAADYESFNAVALKFVSGISIPVPRFVLITKASVSRDVGILKGTVVIYKHFEGGAKATYDGKISDTTSLLHFCEEEGQPTVFPYEQEEFTRKMSNISIKTEHLLIMSSKESRFPLAFRNFKAAAKEFRRNIDDMDVLFVYVDTSKPHIEKVVSYFHVDAKKDLPCNRITRIDKYHSRFVPDKFDMTKEGFVEFTKNVIAGRIMRSVKSDVLPADWNKYPLKVLVGSNYEEVTQQKGKLVFVIYWVAGHKASDEALPIVDEVALMYNLNSTVIVAAMDISRNDGEIDVHYDYPCFKLFTRENKGIKFKGKVTVEAMKAFIDSNGTTQMGYVPKPDDEMDTGIEYLEKLVNEMHPIDYEDEEERERKWRLEADEILKNAVTMEEGKKPHDDPEHMVNPDHHEMHEKGLVTSHDEMDPKAHAKFGDHDHIDIRDAHHTEPSHHENEVHTFEL